MSSSANNTNKKNISVWIVDDDPSIRWVMDRATQNAGISARVFDSGDRIAMMLSNEQPDVLMTDIRMPGLNGLDLLRQLRELHPDLPVIVMTAYTDLDSAHSTYEQGAFEYLAKPFDIEDAIDLIQRAAAIHRRKQVDNAKREEEEGNWYGLVARSAAIKSLVKDAARLMIEHPVLCLVGEQGAGRGALAAALARASNRDVTFTAARRLEGDLESPETSKTLVISDANRMSPELQDKALEWLSQDNERRLLVTISAEGWGDIERSPYFNTDLRHKLAVGLLTIPPLRERKADIPTLAKRFLRRFGIQHNNPELHFSDEAIDVLIEYPWYGNADQLEALCHRLAMTSIDDTITDKELPIEIRQQTDRHFNDWREALNNEVLNLLALGESDVGTELSDDFDRILLEAALTHSNGHRQEAARLLGWGRNTITRKVQRLGIEK